MKGKKENLELDSNPHSFTIRIDGGSSTMIVSSRPNYKRDIFGFFLIIVILVVFLLVIGNLSNQKIYDSHIVVGILIGLLLAIVLFSVLNRRIFYCSLCKRTGVGHYYRSGLMGSGFMQKEFNFQLSDMDHLESRSQRTRNLTQFQVFAVMKNGLRINLSDAGLDYSQCQDYIDQIRDFLDPNLKIIQVDDENFTEEA